MYGECFLGFWFFFEFRKKRERDERELLDNLSINLCFSNFFYCLYVWLVFDFSIVV